MWAAALTPQKLKCPVVVLVTADRVAQGDVRPVALEIVVVAVLELAADIRNILLKRCFYEKRISY